MKDEKFDDTQLKRLAKEKFAVDIEIDKIIVRDIMVGRTMTATVFLTKQKRLFVYLDAHSKLLLGDVKKIISNMGLQAESYIPPINRPDYFDDIGRRKFKEVFPGRTIISSDDIDYYRTLAPYSPAMVLISEVKKGTINGYDSDSKGNWRVVAKFAYRRIKTS